MKKYVLITAAKNEALYIDRTIRSVISQTQKPKLWIIIDDGSKDRTANIAAKYADSQAFIKVIRRSNKNKRGFDSKVLAFKYGYKHLNDIDYDYLGNLDADVSFTPDYYEKLMSYFDDNERLGIGGGCFFDVFKTGKKIQVRTSGDSVRGAVQFFRRKCYQDIGGYIPLPYGGIDSAAEIMARMKGWQVKNFSDLIVLHHKPNEGSLIKRLNLLLRRGMQDQLLGYNLFFEILRCISRMIDPPMFIGGMSILLGYILNRVLWQQKALPIDVVRFLQNEQNKKIFKIGITR